MTEGLPPDFPAPTLPIMRALAVLAAEHAEHDDKTGGQQTNNNKLTRALDALFARHWGPEAAATHKPEVLRETLEGLFGADEAARGKFFTLLFPPSSSLYGLPHPASPTNT